MAAENSLEIKPQVGIIMGSKSDFEVMKNAAEVLERLQVPLEVRIVSAHRTPHWMMEYAEEAEARGIKVVIAGAGGSAHLPGMTASETSIPVLGVAIKGSILDGLDALYSMVRMPEGAPLATLGIDVAGAKNAALFAARILSLNDPSLARRLSGYKDVMRATVRYDDGRLQEVGWQKYDPKG
ncbi:MAG: 5-(carboxyamino)imidazole ribonucleotide mutase [Candidatus Daviesbacteria bacterium]|nr:5-(carboxyamino)imidazole ribonucleotide mutase [Candidatus Daviesbacteria bacterium]